MMGNGIGKNLPKTTTLQPSNHDLDIRIISKQLRSLGAVFGGTVTGEVQEAPAFGGTHAAYDAG
jgi:hypothetical protein